MKTLPIAIAAFSLLMTYQALSDSVDGEETSPRGESPSTPANDPDEPAAGLADFRELFEIIERENAKRPQPAVATKNFSETQRLKIVESILEHLLASKEMANTRDSYRDGGEKLAGLVDSEALKWPKNLPKRIGEYELIRMSEQRADDLEDRAPFLLIEFDRFLSPNDPWQAVMWDSPIHAVVSNYGSPIIIIGGCRAFYAPVLKGKTWIAQYQGSID